MKTISGDLKALGTVSELSAETVSGDVSLMFQNQDPMVDLKTTSGDVEFGFPQKPDIKLHFSTVSGDMEVDDEFGMGDFEGTNISFQLGSGKGAVSVNTVSGDLSIGAKNRF